jgi:hypothetical protein
VVRLQAPHASEQVRRLLRAPQLLPRARAIEIRIDHLRIERDGRAVTGDGLDRLPQFHMSTASVVECLGVIGPQRKSKVIASDRLLETPHRLQRDAVVVVSIGQRRVQRDRAGIVRRGVLEALQSHPQIASPVKRLGALRIEHDRTVQSLGRLVIASQRHQRPAAQLVDAGTLRLLAPQRIEHRQCLGKTLRLQEFLSLRKSALETPRNDAMQGPCDQQPACDTDCPRHH